MTEIAATPPPPRRIERVERTRVSDSVAAQLTQLITGGCYRVGEKLPSERVLSEQFGVSRSSMREAIRSIEAGGLLSISHGVGVFVISTSVEAPASSDLLIFDDFTVPELFEVRRTMEGQASSFAAQRRTAGDVRELQEILSACEEPDLRDEDFVLLDIKLHQAVARSAKNRLLLRLYSNLEPLLLEYSRRVIDLPGRRERAHHGHARIVEAIAASHAREARNAGIDHIRDVEADITKYLTSSDPTQALPA